MRWIYVLLTYLLAPLIIAHDAWQALRNPDYRGRIGQRLGFVPAAARAGTVWIHAVSVGEVQAAAALVAELRRRAADVPITVTTVTPTGAQRARALFKDTVQHCYLPYDLPGSVRRFLDRVQPQIAVMLETEIWPTLYAQLHGRRIPHVLGSARVSARSVDRYQRLGSLFRDALSRGVLIGAQTEVDAERFRAMGTAPERVRVTGNIKYDLDIPVSTVAAGQALRAQWGAARPVWIAGSTHEGEEEACLASHAQVRARHPDALLLLVPRHPQRFDAVRSLLQRQKVSHVQRSAGGLPAAADAVLLVDTLGELQMFYAASDVAFVAGSLVPVGGHSLLEPAVLGLPLVSGPHTQNSQDIADLMQQAGALCIVHDHVDLGSRVAECFDDPARARRAGAAGREAVAANRGAVSRLANLIEPLLRTSA
jgi:3-deoxy-D-manno-octulosonic-acid transferase